MDNLDFSFGDLANIDLSMDNIDDKFEEETQKPKKEEAEKIISETLQSFQDRAKVEAKRFEKATDTEYWFCCYFQTREEKEAFLKAAKLFEHGDKYLDGHFVAKKLGIQFEKDQTGYPQQKIDKKLIEFVD